MIYLNNAKITIQKPDFSSTGSDISNDIKQMLAQILNCSPRNLYLSENGSYGIKTVFDRLISPDDHIITSVLEHPDISAMIQNEAEKGLEVSYIPVNAYGMINYDAIEALIQANTRAIIISHGSYVTGNVINIERISAIARKHGILTIVDGCLAAGNIEVNLQALSPDVYCFSGYKGLMGPYGIGGFYAREGLIPDLIEPSIDNKKMEAFHSSLGFILDRGTYGIAMVPHRLSKRFFESVSGLDQVEIYGDFGASEKLPVVAINVKGLSAKQLKQRLTKDYKIVTEVVTAKENSREYVRVSFGYFNTRREVNDIVWALMELTNQMDFYLLS